MSERLPLFPLPTVLFPGLVLPLHIFEQRYRTLVRELVTRTDDRPLEFAVVALRGGWEVQAPGGATELPTADAAAQAQLLHEVGCTAQLRQVQELGDGGYDIVTVGARRFRMLDVHAGAAPYLTAEVEWLTDDDGADHYCLMLASHVLTAFRAYLRLLGPAGAGIEQVPEAPTVLSHLVAASARLSVEERQQLLAAPDTATRLRTELKLLKREVALLSEIRAVPVPLSDLGPSASLN